MRISRFLFAMGVSLAMALTFSCTEETNEDEPSSASTGDGGSSSSVVPSSSSSEPIAAGFCVVDYYEEEGGACYSGFTNSECTSENMRGRIRTACPADYESYAEACFVSDEYGKYCYPGYTAEDCEGTIMGYSTCLRNEGFFTPGTCVYYDYYDESEECYDSSKYYCQGEESSFTLGATCPLGACYIYDYNTGDERCEDGFTRSECYSNYEGSFSSRACPIKYCAYQEEEDDEGDLTCEQFGVWDIETEADCEDNYDGFVTTYPEYSCEYIIP
jgi:hypothetical protein